MSCQKCCFNPCDSTSICPEGTYWIKRGEVLVKMVEIPPRIAGAVVKAFTEEMK